MADDPAQKILTDYPSFAFLLQDPEVGPLLLDAVDPNKGFDTATFQAKLLQTNWWKNASGSQRQWETLQATDPATASQQRGAWESQVYDLAHRQGVELTQADLDHWAETLMPAGIAANDPRMLESIWQVYSQKPGQRTAQAGDVGALTDQVRSIAEKDYMVPISQASLDTWAHNITNGTATLDGLKSTLGVLAKGRFSAYSDLIDKGITPGQIFAPYQSAIANELELASPDQVDLLKDPRWSQVTGVVGSDNKLRPMTMSEAIQTARGTEQWKGTRNAQSMAAGLTSTILKTFGEM